jgi:dienelactone hydrolase
MTILLATDVFGPTPAIEEMVRVLGQPCRVISPFDDPEMFFLDEKNAYDTFLTQGGVARYAEKLTHLLQAHGTSFQMAIGFSAGASALWIASANEETKQLQANVLFYGSRIRDHQDVQPLCPARLIFAENESAFNATDLCSNLSTAGHQAEIVRGTSHGFMNPYSSGFDDKIQAIYLAQLASLASESGAH